MKAPHPAAPGQIPPDGGRPAVAPGRSLDFVSDVPLTLCVELGRVRMPIRDVLALDEGAVVELDRGEHDPLDVLANDRLIARGEIVALGERIGLRITALVSAEKAVS